MTSSRRHIAPCDAILVRRHIIDGQSVMGPIRLPITDVEKFIEQFNAVYGAAGLSICPLTSSSQEVRKRVDGDSAGDSAGDEAG